MSIQRIQPPEVWIHPSMKICHSGGLVQIGSKLMNHSFHSNQNGQKRTEKVFSKPYRNGNNSLQKVTRIIAFILRFIETLRKKQNRKTKFLTSVELKNATDVLVRQEQRKAFWKKLDP